MKEWLIKKLGGYTEQGFLTTDDFIEHVRSLGLREKNVILTLAVRRLFNTISEDDILKQNSDNTWMFEGKPLTKGEINSLKMQAKDYVGSRLYKVISKDITYQANRKMFIDSQGEIDLTAGKLLLFYNDIVNTRLKNMSNSRL